MKLNTYVWLVVLLFSSTTALFSQAERYTAQAAIDYVNGHSKNGAPDTYLTTVITINGSIPTPLGNIDLNFTFADGKNIIWLYMYYSPSQLKHYFYGVSRVNVFGNITNTAFDINPALLDIDVNTAPKKVIPTPIMGSELIEARLKTNATYNSFKQEYPDSQPNYIALTRLDDEQLSQFTMLNGEDPYWVAQYVNTSDPNYPMSCFVNTKSDEVVCIRAKDFTSVDENRNVSSLKVVPNPSSNTFATIHFSKKYETGVVRLFNALGEVVKDLTPLVEKNSQQLTFSTVGIPSGLYLLNVQNGSESTTTIFVIQ